MKIKTNEKLFSVISLNIVFAIVLAIIYWLIKDRMDYASAVQFANSGVEISMYRMIARSVKYGMLLVSMTFGIFFLFEMIKGLRIHPMQYILVGAALSIFYLLLLSFAEIIGFNFAYLLASIACIALIIWYLQFVLSRRSDVAFVGSLLIITYGVMYVLLSMSQFSLVVGSVILFLALFAVMFFTRNIDWYSLGE